MQTTRRPPAGTLAWTAFVEHLKTTQPDAFEGLTKEVKKKPSIPTHIMTSHIELAILKNEDCPISLSPLTKGTVAYTPCGHLFNYESLCETFKSTQLKSCPTCRAPMTQANITKFI